MLVSGRVCQIFVSCKVSLRVLAAWSDQFKQVVTINSFQGPAETTTHPSKRRRAIYKWNSSNTYPNIYIYMFFLNWCKANKIMKSNMDYSNTFPACFLSQESEHVVLPSGGPFQAPKTPKKHPGLRGDRFGCLTLDWGGFSTRSSGFSVQICFVW